MPERESRLLKLSELAERTGQSEVTLRRQIRKGALPARKVGGWAVRISERDAEDYIRGSRYEPRD